MRSKLNILELFAGSCSFSNTFNNYDNTFTVDWEQHGKIDLVKDINLLGVSDVPFLPDVIWSSPDCTTYSIAAVSKHRNKDYTGKSEKAKQSDKLVKHVIDLIKQWQDLNANLIYFIENPRGMLRKMPFMQEFNRSTIWYCQYGDDRAKPTDIWSNSNTWKPRPECFNGNVNCHHEKAPRGSKTGTQGIKGAYNRSKIPVELCLEVKEAVIKELFLHTEQRSLF